MAFSGSDPWLRWKEAGKIVPAALLFLTLWSEAPAQSLFLTPPANRGQRVPTPGYQSKAFPLKPLANLKKDKVSRFIPFPKKIPVRGKNAGTFPTPTHEGKPVTAWGNGIQKNYSTMYQDPRP